MQVVFEWDASKAESNRRKHRISFEEARTVFQDPLAFIFPDENHSVLERRELIIGTSILGSLMIVSFTETAKNRVRIISARKATKREQRDYEEQIQS